MNAENTHRLLRRQIKKANLSNEQIEALMPFLKSVDEAYRSFDNDHKHLENVLEVNSMELYKANKQLKSENILRVEEANKAKTSLNKVIDNVNDIILEMDKNGNFTYLNPSWEKFAEESPEVSLGKNYLEFTNGIMKFDLDLNERIESRDFDNFTTVFSRKNKAGDLKWWELSTKMILTQDGKIDGAIASIMDVTSLKETEQELIHANQSKTRFLSTMSHEIRTPLNAVIAISNILLMEDPKPEQLENLKTLKFSSKHLLHLINDILDYNKLISGRLNFDNSPFNLRKEVANTIHSVGFTAKDKGLELKLEFGENVPEYVSGDSHRLCQVIANLVSNAIKFTHRGSVHVIVNCQPLSNEKAKLLFEVKDTGIGIEQDKLKFIFDRFTQAEADTTKKFGGTGLGLAICKKIIELQGSQIKVESQVSKGTSFSFDLEFDIAEQFNDIDQDYVNMSEFKLVGKKLLVVDDNEINLMVIKQFLDKWEIQYDDAKDGVEAVEKIKNNKYDLVLLDLQMPRKDGFTVSREIRAINELYYTELPIIALSASVSIDITDRVIAAGMNDYLCKPFDPEVLFQKLNWYCSKRSMVTVS